MYTINITLRYFQWLLASLRNTKVILRRQTKTSGRDSQRWTSAYRENVYQVFIILMREEARH